MPLPTTTPFLMPEPTNTPGLYLWALVELMGRSKIVGLCQEQNIAGTTMLRVDVPTEDGEGVRFTRYFGGSAIYGISPIGKELAVEMANRMDPAPVQAWDVPQLRDRLKEEFTVNAVPAPSIPAPDYDPTDVGF